MNNTKSKIFIIDPSLLDIRGHHYTLTQNVTKGALILGYSVTWLVNEKFKQNRVGIDGHSVSVIGAFSTSAYNINTVAFKINKSLLNRYGKFLNELKLFLNHIFRFIYKKVYKKIYKKITGKKPKLSGRLFDFILDSWRYEESNEQAKYKRLSNTLKSIMANEECSSKDHFFIHTADSNLYWAILDFFILSNDYDQPFIHMCTPYIDSYMPHKADNYPVYDAIKSFDLLGLLNVKVFLYAENDLLANYLSSSWKVNVTPLPLPCPANVGQKEKSNKSMLNVVFLGAARKEKGFLMLPKLVEKFSNSNKYQGKIKFTIQCSQPIAGYEDGVLSCVEELSTYDHEYVRLIKEPLSVEGYYAELENADVMMLCYQQDRYQWRGSGIAVEAVIFGCIVIATPNTFPFHVAQEASLSGLNVDESVSSLEKVIENYEYYYESASNRSREYQETNSCEQYVNKFVSMVMDDPKSMWNISKNNEPDMLDAYLKINDHRLMSKLIN